jgi:hypothetical protein
LSSLRFTVVGIEASRPTFVTFTAKIWFILGPPSVGDTVKLVRRRSTRGV